MDIASHTDRESKTSFADTRDSSLPTSTIDNESTPQVLPQFSSIT